MLLQKKNDAPFALPNFWGMGLVLGL